jgi:hypothetical protein
LDLYLEIFFLESIVESYIEGTGPAQSIRAFWNMSCAILVHNKEQSVQLRMVGKTVYMRFNL